MHPSKKRKLLGEGECNIIFLEVAALSQNKGEEAEKIFFETDIEFFALCVLDTQKSFFFISFTSILGKGSYCPYFPLMQS
jgi:hypothetical protein